ncbi:hypothetical protein KBX63_25520 [Micromonospora sp. U21]|nr:hypothetical protein [Micromonospora sp. U21]MBQ0905317.1 hypothetical protein [Micromonospora sp. U21]
MGRPAGNRANRFLAGVAYLDGVDPSAIMARGYYAKTTVAAYSMRGNELILGDTFDSGRLPDPTLGEERGVHSLMASDVDADGRDEIVYGAMVLESDLSIKTVPHTWFPYPALPVNVDLTPQIKNPDENARFVYLAHGDAMHIAHLDPTRPGTEPPRLLGRRPDPRTARRQPDLDGEHRVRHQAVHREQDRFAGRRRHLVRQRQQVHPDHFGGSARRLARGCGPAARR